MREHVDAFGFSGLEAGSDDALRYLARHDHAKRWAAANRQLIAIRVLERLRSEGDRVVDICHNWVENENSADGPAGCIARAPRRLPKGLW